jgi:hypothetical protein
LSAPIQPVAAGGKDLVIAGPASSQSLSPAAAPSIFINTGNLNTARTFHTATLLQSGKVLVAGGSTTADNTGALDSWELYDPASGISTATGNLNSARSNHTATMLPSGKVLVVGGADASGNALSSAELFDPATGMWTLTNGIMGAARFAHTATLLPSGQVLVAGGIGTSNTFLSSAELYDPASGTWSTAGNLSTARQGHTATLLASG